MRVLGLVPARGGSKGVPRKNIRLLGGRPLLDWTAAAAAGATGLTRTVLSTDDEEIAEVGRASGLEVPFLRSAELALDTTPTLAVVQDVVRRLEREGVFYDAVCLLQPTSPFRTAADIDACIARLGDAVDSVLSIRPVPAEYNPHWVYTRDPDGALSLFTGARSPIPRRQDLPTVYHRDGAVYVTRRNVLMDQNSLYGQHVVGYAMDAERWVNIDTRADWERAEDMARAIAGGVR